MIMTRFPLHKDIYFPHAAPSSAMRLVRTINSEVKGASFLIKFSMRGFNSGAPPVISMVSKLFLVA